MQTYSAEATPVPDSPATLGAPMELDAFKKWIEHAESTETISIEEAKLRWTQKRIQLQQGDK